MSSGSSDWGDKTEPMTQRPEFFEMLAQKKAQEKVQGADKEEKGGRGSSEAACLAEFDSPEACLKAAAAVRDAGYRHWDVHTPYPVHGMDDAMGLKPTKLGIISFLCGITGCLSAILMIQYMNGYDYPIVVGGKPPEAITGMIPIMFELSILLTGFGTIFGLLGLTKLPRHHHVVFESSRFAASSDDKFFISIEARDPKFDSKETLRFMESLKPSHLEYIQTEAS